MKGFSGWGSKKLSGGQFLFFLLTCAGVLHQEWSHPHKLEEEGMIIRHLEALKFQLMAIEQPIRFYSTFKDLTNAIFRTFAILQMVFLAPKTRSNMGIGTQSQKKKNVFT